MGKVGQLLSLNQSYISLRNSRNIEVVQAEHEKQKQLNSRRRRRWSAHLNVSRVQFGPVHNKDRLM